MLNTVIIGCAAAACLAAFVACADIRVSFRTRIVALVVAFAASTGWLYAAEARTPAYDYGDVGLILLMPTVLLIILTALFWKTIGPKAS